MRVRLTGGSISPSLDISLLKITTNPDEFVRQLHSYTHGNTEVLAHRMYQNVCLPIDKPELPHMSTSPSRWPELMSISTLAEYLDMSESSVRKLVADGILPNPSTAPTPRLKRWKRSEIDDTLQRIAERKHSVGPSMADALRLRGGQ